MAAPNEQQGAVEQALNKLWSKVFGWVRKVISAVLLVAIGATALGLLGVPLFGLPTIPLTQETGIGMAGLGFLLSKI